MRAKSCVLALLACAACSASRQDLRSGQDSGWPLVRASNDLDSASIAEICDRAEPDYLARHANPETGYRLFAVRYATCTTNRLRQGRTQCSFEIGETGRKIYGDNDVAAARVKRWRPVRAAFSYRRVGVGEFGEHDWMESWWADEPCRP
jgi:hypothetical protein